MIAFQHSKSSDELIAMGIAPIIREHWLEKSLPVTIKSAEEAVPEQKLSKRQKKKNLKAARTRPICYDFMRGQCKRGDCKFSHDKEAFVASQPKALPGQCPYSKQPKCPYGVTCCWANLHPEEDRGLPAPGAVTEASTGVPSDAPTAAAAWDPAPAGSSLEDQPNGAAAAATPSPTSGAAAAEQAAVSSPSPAKIEQQGGTETGRCKEEVAEQAAGSNGMSRDVGGREGPGEEATAAVGAETEVVTLPVLPLEGETINGISRDLQHKLRTRTYDFSAPDSLIKNLSAAEAPAKTKRKQSLAGAAAGKREAEGGDGCSEPGSKRLKAEDGGATRAPSTGGGPSGGAGEEDGAADEDTGSGVDHAGAAEGGENGKHSDGEGLEGKAAGAAANAEADAGLTTGREQDGAAVEPARAADGGLGKAEANGQEIGGSTGAKATNAVPLWTLPVGEEDWRQLHVDTPYKFKERPTLDLRGKLYLAPLTTIGNLPFRRVCKQLGADVTCGEMAVCTNLLQGQTSEWALLKRHPCEDLYGVQICGGYPDSMLRCASLLEEHVDVDFVDINCGCPIDLICAKNGGSSLLLKPNRIKQLVQGMSSILTCPLTVKMRRGYYDGADVAHSILPHVASWGAAAATLHGRSRQQRYSRQADWGYINTCVEAAKPLPLIGNGDIFSFTDYKEHMEATPQLCTTMIARGAIIKPWIFTEIKEERHWDISASERLDLLKEFCACGLLHWGSDKKGVENTRRFLLEWLSYLCRYIPAGLLEVLPQKMNWRPPYFSGRSDLETLMGSQHPSHWVQISEMLLGPVPPGFSFSPKHKSNAYSGTGGGAQENG